MQHMFGSLPIPGGISDPPDRFPHNISFHTADWVDRGLPEDAQGYDIVLAFVHSWLCPHCSKSQQVNSADFQFPNGYISMVETRVS